MGLKVSKKSIRNGYILYVASGNDIGNQNMIYTNNLVVSNEKNTISNE